MIETAETVAKETANFDLSILLLPTKISNGTAAEKSQLVSIGPLKEKIKKKVKKPITLTESVFRNK